MQASTQLAPQTTQISDDALVENRITGLLSQNNPYMQQATTRGNQEAQSRGLLSSSLAAGAVEGERIRAALPIAQQDAQTFGNRDLQDGAYTQQGNLNNQAFGQQQVLNEQTFGQNRQLNQDQFGYQQQLNEQGFSHQQQLNTQQNAAQASLQENNQAAEIRLNTNNQIAAIEQNPNMSPQQRDIAIRNLLNLQNAQIAATTRGQEMANTTFVYRPSSRLPNGQALQPGQPLPPGATQSSLGNIYVPSQDPNRPRPTQPTSDGSPWAWDGVRGMWRSETEMRRTGAQ